jgi:mutator protein MutT
LIPVVAAVVQKEGRFLLCQRAEGKRHGGLWEFPGGKLLEGETFDAAAARELAEELRVRVSRVGSEVGQFQDAGSEFAIHFLEVAIEGSPIAHEHQALGWFTLEEVCALALAPADRAFVQTLSRPESD